MKVLSHEPYVLPSMLGTCFVGVMKSLNLNLEDLILQIPEMQWNQ